MLRESNRLNAAIHCQDEEFKHSGYVFMFHISNLASVVQTLKLHQGEEDKYGYLQVQNRGLGKLKRQKK